MKRVLISAGATVLVTGAAAAHSGDHQLTVAQSMLHLLGQPDHLALIGVAVAIGSFALARFNRA